MTSAVSPNPLIRFPRGSPRPARLRVEFTNSEEQRWKCRRRSGVEHAGDGGTPWRSSTARLPTVHGGERRARAAASVAHRGMRRSREGQPGAEVGTPRDRHRGGWGGATAAKYVRLQDPSIEVVLLEPEPDVRLLPVQQPRPERRGVARTRSRSATTVCGAHGVKIRHEAATAIEPDTKRVRHRRGLSRVRPPDRRPGVDFPWSQVEGVAGQEARRSSTRGRRAPRHVELARRLQALPDGGVVAMTVPHRAVPLPARALRASLPDRVVSQDDQAPGQAGRAGRQQRRRSRRPRSSRRPSAPIPTC